ncbi:hypothetical protein ACFVT1_31165 [Streptomyces sp. NPDC057963]|uniref:hypothetical protein n=1 Tax=Streptomyces sp. NPDC057963 TaxID=3346290 RepID=UPI0036E5D73B
MTLRLPKAELPIELKENTIKQLGVVPENVEVLWQSPRATQDNLEFGARVGAWDAVGPGLKPFAHMAVTSQVGCSRCLDVGYFHVAADLNVGPRRCGPGCVCRRSSSRRRRVAGHRASIKPGTVQWSQCSLAGSECWPIPRSGCCGNGSGVGGG